MARERTWALVTNGVRARILQSVEEGNAEPPIEVVSKAPSLHLREYLTDRSGRSFASAGGGRRSAMEPGSDPVLRDMQDFAAQTLSVLEDYQRGGRFNRLAVFAAPKMLGILRAAMPAALREALVHESDANLIGLPEAELRQVVRDRLGREKSG